MKNLSVGEEGDELASPNPFEAVRIETALAENMGTGYAPCKLEGNWPKRRAQGHVHSTRYPSIYDATC